ILLKLIQQGVTIRLLECLHSQSFSQNTLRVARPRKDKTSTRQIRSLTVSAPCAYSDPLGFALLVVEDPMLASGDEFRPIGDLINSCKSHSESSGCSVF